jgi:RimJ/RimL family protein N-acetyltransferase
MKHSRLESRRFGFNVYRTSAKDIDPDSLLASIIENDVDLAILTVPARSISDIHRLDAMGVPFIVADTLIDYILPHEGDDRSTLRMGLDFVPCTPADEEVFVGLVEEVYAHYRGHYATNPFLPPEKVIEGYKEWMASFCGGYEDPDEERIGWLVEKEGRPIGFMSVFYDKQGEDRESFGGLWGLIPSEQRKGYFFEMLSFCRNHFKDLGFSGNDACTQAHNTASQAVLEAVGYRPRGAEMKIHINAFMQHSVIDPHEDTLSPGPATRPAAIIDQAAEDVYAKRLQGWQLGRRRVRLLGEWTHPARCTIQMNFPMLDEESRCARTTIKLRAPNGDLCALAYDDLSLRI